MINYLEVINNELEGTPFKIAYRTRNEALLYVVNNLPYRQDEDLEEGEELKEEFFLFFSFLLLTNPCIFAAETKKDMDFYNRYRPSDEHRREELIRKIEAAVNSLTLEELEALHYDMLTKNYGMNELGEL